MGDGTELSHGLGSWLLVTLTACALLACAVDGEGVDVDSAAVDPADVTSEPFMYRQNVQRHGFQDVDVGAAYRMRWKAPGINPGTHTANKAGGVFTADGRHVIIPSDSGTLYCFDVMTGELVWGSAVFPSSFGIHGTPAVANGTVYIGAYDGAMYAFDLETGVRRWRTKIGGSIGSSPLVYRGVVYVTVETPIPTGILALLDAATGEVIWEDRNTIMNHPHSSVALDVENGVMVTGANDAKLYAWSMEGERELLWAFDVTTFGGKSANDSCIKGPITVYDSTAYFGSWDGYLYAISTTTGELRWATDLESKQMAGVTVDVSTGLVYQGSYSTGLFCLDAATGAIQWQYKDAKAHIHGPATLTRSAVLFGAGDGYIRALNKTDGELLWKWVEKGKRVGQISGVVTVSHVDKSIVFASRSTQRDGSCWGRCVNPGTVYMLESIDDDDLVEEILERRKQDEQIAKLREERVKQAMEKSQARRAKRIENDVGAIRAVADEEAAEEVTGEGEEDAVHDTALDIE